MENLRGTRSRNIADRSQSRSLKKTGRTRSPIPLHLVRMGSFTTLMINPLVLKKTACIRTCPHNSYTTRTNTGSPADQKREDE